MRTSPKGAEAQAGPPFRELRMQAGVTQRAVSTACRITPSTLSRWERGERSLAAATYARLVVAFGELIGASQDSSSGGEAA